MGVISCISATALILCLLCQTSWSGSSCPSFKELLPCYCTTGGLGSGMIMICSGIDNSSQLMEATKAAKGMVFDRFLLFNSFHRQSVDVNETNELVAEQNERERLPTQWLSALRVRDIRIQYASLSSCFLCNEPFVGQTDFLVSLSVSHSSLDGHLCNTCNTRTKSVSMRELIKVPRLKFLDLSWNDIEFIDGLAFPVGMTELTKVILSNNKIKTIHDNAFRTLNQLTELDLSNNQLTAISRRTFSSGALLQTLDLSWNSLQYLPEGLLNDLRNLKELKLAYNLIEVLPSDTWSRMPANIEKLDFKGNFLVCNCSLSWMSRFLPKPTKISGRCVNPPEVESQEIKSSLTTLRSCP